MCLPGTGDLSTLATRSLTHSLLVLALRLALLLERACASASAPPTSTRRCARPPIVFELRLEESDFLSAAAFFSILRCVSCSRRDGGPPRREAHRLELPRPSPWSAAARRRLLRRSRPPRTAFALLEVVELRAVPPPLRPRAPLSRPLRASPRRRAALAWRCCARRRRVELRLSLGTLRAHRAPLGPCLVAADGLRPGALPLRRARANWRSARLLVERSATRHARQRRQRAVGVGVGVGIGVALAADLLGRRAVVELGIVPASTSVAWPSRGAPPPRRRRS